MRIWLLYLVLFTAACQPDRQDVVDNAWVVVSYRLTETDSLRNAPRAFTLSFDDRKSFSFQLDVNRCGGSVNFKPNNIVVFSQTPTCTEACCDSPYALGVLSALKEVNRFELLNEQLILTGNGGLRINLVRQ